MHNYNGREMSERDGPDWRLCPVHRDTSRDDESDATVYVCPVDGDAWSYQPF